MAAITRREMMLRSAILGCSAAASPLVTPVALASVPGDNRLVVIILRGAMDGLDVVQPYGDPALAAARPGFGIGPAAGARDLDGFFCCIRGCGISGRSGRRASWVLRMPFPLPIATRAAISTARICWRPEPPQAPQDGCMKTAG